jgi:uncharacterized membrane protein YesL
MNSLSPVLQTFWTNCLWILLAIAGLLAVVALVSPATFRSLAKHGGQWLDSSKLVAFLDKQIDIDRLVLPYSRVLGAAVIATIAILCFRFSGG